MCKTVIDIKPLIWLGILFVLLSACLQANDIHGQPEELVVSNETALEAWSDLKFGMFIHWGIYSTQGSYWDGQEISGLAEHLQRTASVSQPEYARISQQFYPHRYDPDKWVQLAKDAGMKYIVITSKHHDGFCLFDSKYTDFDMVDATPWGRDVLKPLAAACAAEDIKLGFYYSFPDWHVPHPRRQADPGYYNVFEEIPPEMEVYILNQLKELLTGYGPLCELFFDMGNHTPQQSALMTATIHRLQPTCVVNGRVMNNMGDFLTMNDNALPRHPISQRWETPGTLYHWDKSEIQGWDNKRFDTWAYKAFAPRPDMHKQLDKQIGKLAMITSKGGNFLLNIGPMADGTVLQYEQQVLRNIGRWMKKYGEAIHGTKAAPFRNVQGAWCSLRPGRLYLLIDDWKRQDSIRLPGMANQVTRAATLGDPQRTLEVTRCGDDVLVTLNGDPPDPYVSVAAVDFQGELDVRESLVRAGKGAIELTGESVLDEIHYENMNFMEMPHVVAQRWRVEFTQIGTYEVTLQSVRDLTARRQYIEDQDDHFRQLLIPLEGLEFTLSIQDKQLRFTLDDASRQGTGNEAVLTKSLGRVRLDSPGICMVEIKRSDRQRNFRRKEYEPMGIDVQRLTFKPIE